MFDPKKMFGNYAQSGLVNLNWATLKDIPVAGKRKIPSVCGIGMRLTVPGTLTGNINTGLYEIDAGFYTAIQKIESSIRSANTSVSDFETKDVLHYVINVRLLHAIYASARRLYAMGMTYDIYDARVPLAYFLVQGSSPRTATTFFSTLADMRVFGSQLGLKIASNYPLKLPIIDQTRYYFSTFFDDSNDAKAVPYMFILNNNGSNGQLDQLYWDDINNQYRRLRFENTVSGYRDAADTVMNAMATKRLRSIANELFKAFGSDMIYPAEIWGENEAVPHVYDELVLTQIQNAFNVIPTTPNVNEFGVEQPEARVFTITGYDVPESVNIDNLAIYINERYVNTYKDKMSSEECLAALRFVSPAEASATLDGLTQVKLTMRPTCWGTEKITNFYYVATDEAGNEYSSTPTECITYYPTASSTTDTFDELHWDTSNWASMDWGPRIVGYSDFTFQSQSVIYDMWDWNNYAPLPSKNSMLSMLSMGNTSLLYVPVIVKQSNWNEIDLNTGKTKRRDQGSTSNGGKKHSGKKKSKKDVK